MTKHDGKKWIYKPLGESEIDGKLDEALAAYNKEHGGGWRHSQGSCGKGYVCSIYRGATATTLAYGMLDRASAQPVLQTHNATESVLSVMGHEMIHYRTGLNHGLFNNRMGYRQFGIAEEAAVRLYKEGGK